MGDSQQWEETPGQLRESGDFLSEMCSDLLIARARAQTGLSNFGSSSFVPGLDELLNSLRNEGRLTAEGWASVRSTILRRLANRLRVEAFIEQHPEVADAEVTGPVSIIGLERTGTTALANMMSLDPQFRCLRGWEQAEPCPPPVLEEESQDRRRLESMARIAREASARPERMAMHLYDVDATVEDHDLLGLEFRAQQGITPAFGYHAWWRECDMRAAYSYHRRVIGLLQSRRPPNRWLFKAPHHRFHLEAMLAAYPDARFVFTHRDPAKAVPSFASFVLSLYPPGAAARQDRKRVGRLLHEHMLRGVEKAMEARARIGEKRFLDVHQHEISGDPLGTIERVYAWLGLPLGAQTIVAVRDWHAVNHSGAHGRHAYSPEDFGLTREAIRADFADYISRFGVRLEEDAPAAQAGVKGAAC